MKTKRTLTITTLLIALAALTTLGGFPTMASLKAEAASHLNTEYGPLLPPLAASTPDYQVAPSNTDADGNDNGHTFPKSDCPGPGIGCNGDVADGQWGEYAPNDNHVLYLPPSKRPGKLLVFLNGAGATPGDDTYFQLYTVAASQGYHVIGLTYYDTGVNGCHNDLSCYGDFIREELTGDVDCSSPNCVKLNITEHPQDSIVNRLKSVLKWARSKHDGDGWERYLTASDDVKWDQINLAGFSQGSGYVAMMGMLYPVGRVTLFSSPNDGKGDTEAEWKCADWIQRIEGVTDTRYFGLVHQKNHAETLDADGQLPLYRVTKAWHKFGMEGPLNRARFEFIPSLATTPAYFDGAHMLISTDEDTTAHQAHSSVVRDRYCESDNDPEQGCVELGTIGYEPAWRCILGTGNALVSNRPDADAGPAQTVECEGGGGANVTLDGSGSRDIDCDGLSYEWTGSFGVATGRKPTVFLPVGAHLVNLVVKDEWSSSDSKTVLITVRDTHPPILNVTLTPTQLWPANHKLVRIDATVSAADSCGGAPPHVVLTSITSDQPGNGGGDGNTTGDIQGAAFGTFDRSFYLRAERAGNDLHGRTYTVIYTATDTSGNSTQTSATVFVPHSR